METHLYRDRQRVGSNVIVRAFFSRLVSLGKNLVRKKRNECDLSEEIACHLELLIAENIRAGLSESEARRAALLEFGGAEQIKEQVREVRAGYSLDVFLQDLRYGARVLRRSPLFATTAVLTVALALGASGAAFTLLKSRLLRPLDYPGSGELLQISAARETHDTDVSFPRFRQIEAQHDVFADVAALVGERSAILRGGVAQQVNVARVSDRFFETLAFRPLLGRIFSPAENGVALLSYDYWQKQFAGDPGTVGCVITLGGIQTKIVGIVPRGLRIPFGEFDIYAPQVTAITFLSGEQMQRGAGFLKVIARSRSGVSFEQVREALRVIDKDYHERAHENMDGDVVSRAAPLRESADGARFEPVGPQGAITPVPATMGWLRASHRQVRPRADASVAAVPQARRAAAAADRRADAARGRALADVADARARRHAAARPPRRRHRPAGADGARRPDDHRPARDVAILVGGEHPSHLLVPTIPEA